MTVKSSKTILYLIFATIGALLFVYYLLDNNGQHIAAVVEDISEINLDKVTHIVSDGNFGDIKITL